MLSTGRLVPTDEWKLPEARETVLTNLAAELGVARTSVESEIRREYVEIDGSTDVTWQGLEFTAVAPGFGSDDPTPDEKRRLRDCFELYRSSVPEGMRVELYGNRVRIEPGAFGRRGAIVNALGAQLAEAVPDEHDIQVGPSAAGLDQAREQFHRALQLPIPDGFVRVVLQLEGFEDEGDIGHIHLLHKDRWDLDRPC